jgi:hypothetical protein
MTAALRYQPWTVKDLSYVCKYYRRGNGPMLAMDLNRTAVAIRVKVYQLKKAGLYDYYKKLDI